MVKIRLRRIGRKNRPYYRVVVADSRTARDGKYIETLGQYDPKAKSFQVKSERVSYWLSKGAKPTATVGHLLTRQEKERAKAVVEPEPQEGGTP